MNAYKRTNARKRWLRFHEPDADGNYTCALCLKPVHVSIVTLDHIKPQRYYPYLAAYLSNLQPAHERCNIQRGKFIDQVMSNSHYTWQINKQNDSEVVERMQRYLVGAK